MTRLAVYLSLLPARLGRAFRAHGFRIALGAAIGWLSSSVLGAMFVVAIGSDSNLLAAVIVWTGTGLGAGGAYALR